MTPALRAINDHLLTYLALRLTLARFRALVMLLRSSRLTMACPSKHNIYPIRLPLTNFTRISRPKNTRALGAHCVGEVQTLEETAGR